MKVYIVMTGPEKVLDCDDATVFLGTYFEPEVFMEKGDAVDAAQ